MLLIILAVVVSILAYYALSARYTYWKKRNVPTVPPSLLLGNLGDILTMQRSVGQVFTDIYNKFPEHLYVGYYKVGTPGLVIRDPELVKNIFNKDFNTFHDNDIIVDKDSDPISARSLVFLKGQQWKYVKNQLTPCFTTKKLKSMHVLVENGVNKLINYLEEESDATGPNGLEVRELSGKYVTEVLACCAFGLEGRSFDEPRPMFKSMANTIFEPSLSTMLKILTILMVPSLSAILRIGFVSKKLAQHFYGIITSAVKYRKENGIFRNDFLDYMIELKNKTGHYEFTDLDVTAHASGFFNAGYETSSATMAFILFELSVNPDVCQKLREEVDEALLRNGGNLDYDAVNELLYLHAVINETLRVHPVGTVILRVCTQPFTFPSARGLATEDDVEVELGTPIVIPVYALHHDPKYFPDPETFNPERFSPANKDSIVKGTFLPFGDGPRSCIGLRFALMEIKLALVHIVANYDIKLNKKTVLPMVYDQKYLVPHAKGGLWLNFYKRK